MEIADELFLNPLVSKSVNETVRSVARQQRNYLPVEELRQDAWTWVFGNTTKIVTWLEADETPSGKNVRGLMSSSIRVHLHGIVQKERMRNDGTFAEDYYYYSKAVVEEFLPNIFDEYAGSSTASSAPRGTFVTHSKQPSEGFEYQAMLADIRNGFNGLASEDRLILSDRYADGGIDTTIMALAAGVTQRTMRYRLSRAINRLIRNLGGEIPRQRRRVQSNASAQVATRQQESGQ